jgi:hypothetical protein
MYKFNLLILAFLAMLASMGLSQPPSTVAVEETNLNGLVLSMQGVYFTHPSELTAEGVTNNSIVVYGSSLIAGHGTHMPQYLGATYEQVHHKFSSFVASRNLSNTTDYVLLDMETPAPPKKWGHLLTQDEDDDGTKFAAIITAFKLRITVARALLPHAKLCLYGTPVPRSPHPTGAGWLQQLAGYTRAGQLGAFDGADYICPVCYMRFGVDDHSNYMTKIHTATDMAINAAKTFVKADGSHIPVLPLISPNVYNGNSKSNRKLVSAHDLWQQITWIKAHDIDTCLLWIPSEKIPETTTTIPQYLGHLRQAAE